MVEQALLEDIGACDISAQLIDPSQVSSATVINREAMCLCGVAWFEQVFYALDPSTKIIWNYHDGNHVVGNSVLCTLTGNTRALLSGERSALNFLQLLSGTATITYEYMEILHEVSINNAANKDTALVTRLLDTRKTIPGYRMAQKYAVRCGGGHNHRFGLYDAFLLKENHIAAANGIAKALIAARQLGLDKLIEIEVENLEQLEEAIYNFADIILLDNFSDADLLLAVEKTKRLAKNTVKLEVSGNVNKERLKYFVSLGIDYISVGNLTKNVKAIDLSMKISNHF